MKLLNVVRKYFSNVFISIIPESNRYKVYSKVIKKGKIEEKFEREFDIIPKRMITPSDMERYLFRLQDKYGFAYISYHLNSVGQGLYPE